MKKILLVIALLFLFHCHAQSRLDTNINVVSNGTKQLILHIIANNNLLMYYLYDSMENKNIESKMLPKANINGRSNRKVILDSLKSLKLRYNLTFK